MSHHVITWLFGFWLGRKATIFGSFFFFESNIFPPLFLHHDNDNFIIDNYPCYWAVNVEKHYHPDKNERKSVGSLSIQSFQFASIQLTCSFYSWPWPLYIQYPDWNEFFHSCLGHRDCRCRVFCCIICVIKTNNLSRYLINATHLIQVWLLPSLLGATLKWYRKIDKLFKR